jgi:hypothetical protein
MVAAKLANISVGTFVGNQHVLSANLQTAPVSQSTAAELLNVSTRTVANAKRVTEDATPELVQAVDPATDPWAYVWSLNGERRDLTADQRYLIWKSCHEKSEAWESEKRRIFSDANRKRAEATKAQHEVSNPRAGETMVQPQLVAKPDYASTKSATAKAEASKTNRGSVERMDALANNRSDLAEKVKTGEIKSAEAIREMKREELVAKLEDVKTKEVKAAAGVYDVIVMDPPWPMQKIDRDER